MLANMKFSAILRYPITNFPDFSDSSKMTFHAKHFRGILMSHNLKKMYQFECKNLSAKI